MDLLKKFEEDSLKQEDGDEEDGDDSDGEGSDDETNELSKRLRGVDIGESLYFLLSLAFSDGGFFLRFDIARRSMDAPHTLSTTEIHKGTPKPLERTRTTTPRE